jgi:hypothetical protein
VAGPRGADGVAGAMGPVGPSGATNAVVRFGAALDVVPGGGAILQAGCLDGERAIGGGAAPTAGGFIPEATITSSFPAPTVAGGTPTSWNVGVKNTGASTNLAFQSYVICVAP